MSGASNETGGPRRGRGRPQDFELNIASIIDCFTVLITYLLASASFITLGSLDITVATVSAETPDTAPPELIVSVLLSPEHQVRILTEGKEKSEFSVKPTGSAGDQWDFESVNQHLAEIKQRFPSVQAAMVAADEKVKYGEVVRAIETIRRVFPKTAISADYGGV